MSNSGSNIEPIALQEIKKVEAAIRGAAESVGAAFQSFVESLNEFLGRDKDWQKLMRKNARRARYLRRYRNRGERMKKK